MFFILAGLIVLTIVGIIVSNKSYDFDIAWKIIALISGVMAAAIIIAWMNISINTANEIQSFEATKATIEQSRKGDNKLENAALTQKIIESNQWLQQTKYWKNTIFGDLYPNSINELEPLE